MTADGVDARHWRVHDAVFMTLTVAHVTTVDMSLRYLLLNQLRFLQERGYRVLGVSSPGPDVHFVEEAGIRHIAVPMTRRMSPLADLKAVQDLARVFARERVDIVHTHTPKPGLLGQMAARLVGVPVVVNTIHGFYFHDHMKPLPRRFFILMEQLAAAHSDAILSQNPEDIRTAIDEHIAPPMLLSPLGNGIDLSRFTPDAVFANGRAATRAELGFGAGDVVVGFVGRLVEEKGLPELFDAVVRLRERHPHVKLLVIGPEDHDKPDATGQQAARMRGLDEDAAHFTGLRHDLPRLYAAMDVFVLPSHREGFPRAPMEAAAMGLPVVATDIRGCRETVKDGVTGALVPLRDAAALEVGIARYVDDADLRRRHGDAGRVLARATFDERLVFARVAACYEEVLARKGRR
jgi:glycosyltransferase involved in cell wall biosynthesis